MSIMIHNREYITVAERIQLAGHHLMGVSTEILNDNPVVIKATVTIVDRGTFTGISAANPSKAIEKASPYEVAETSAVGRALGFAGFGIIEGMATADEIVKAEASDPIMEATKGQNEYSSEDNVNCPIHKIKLIHFEKNGKEWWSHKNTDGTWCNGKI